MEYKSVKKLYLELTSKIDLLFKNANFVSLLKSNDALSDVFLDQISIVKFLETKLSDFNCIEEHLKERQKKSNKKNDSDSLIDLDKLNKAEKYLEEFKKIKFGISNFKEENFKNIDEIKDAINYLNVFMKNTFKKDIDEFLVAIPVQDKSNESEATKKETASAERVSANSNFDNNTSSNFFGGQNQSFAQMNSESMKENYLYSIASQRLNQDIINGTFYKFKTKPQAILIIKKIIGICFALIALIGLGIIISSWLANDLMYQNKNFNEGESYPILAQSNLFNTIFGIFYICVYGYLGFLMFKPEKNENKKYDFPKMILIFLTIIIIMQLFSLIQYTVSLFTIIDEIENTPGHFGNTNFSINSGKAYLYLSIIQDSLYVVIIIMIVLAYVYAPKIDVDRINMKIKEYMDQMRGQI